MCIFFLTWNHPLISLFLTLPLPSPHVNTLERHSCLFRMACVGRGIGRPQEVVEWRERTDSPSELAPRFKVAVPLNLVSGTLPPP